LQPRGAKVGGGADNQKSKKRRFDELKCLDVKAEKQKKRGDYPGGKKEWSKERNENVTTVGPLKR